MLKDVISTLEFHLDGCSQLPLIHSEALPQFPSGGGVDDGGEQQQSYELQKSKPSDGVVITNHQESKPSTTKIHTISTSARSFFEVTNTKESAADKQNLITTHHQPTIIQPTTTSDTRTWEELETEAAQCRKCRLCEKRKNVVFGVGNKHNPKIVFVGEGPGADEDQQGEPFVGKAGKLLTSAIENGLKLKRNDVYICNVVKCRPPENRVPMDDEVQACAPYLYRQLTLTNPQVIITLGQPAQKALIGIDMGITKLRGQWQNWRGIKLMPTFHPAYILRNPPAKRPFWEDLQAVMREVGL